MSSETINVGSIDPSWDMLIGAYSYSSARNGNPQVISANGLIDELRIYNRALNASEVVVLSGSTSTYYSDNFDTLDTNSWEVVGGTWSVSNSILSGTWSLSAAQTDQGNLLLNTSVLGRGNDFSASFVFIPGTGNGKFSLYNSAGNKYNIAFGLTSFSAQIRQGGAAIPALFQPQITRILVLMLIALLIPVLRS